VFQRFFPLAAAQLESSCIPHYPPYERGRTSGTQGRNMAEYHDIFPEYTGTSRYFPMVAMRLFINMDV
jgi:hypothetical protein